MPTSNLAFQSPFKIVFQTDPNYSKLKIFGCLCFPWLRPYTSNKLDPRSVPCIFLGYSLTQSAFFCWQPHTNRMYVSRHVRFEESIFPFKSLLQQNTISSTENLTSFPPTATHVPFTVPPLISAHLAPSPPLGSPNSDSTPATLMPSPTLSPPTSPAMSSSGSQESTSSSAQSTSPSQTTHIANPTENEPNNISGGLPDTGPTDHSSASAHLSSNMTSPTAAQPTNSQSSSDSSSPSGSDDESDSSSPPPPPPLDNAHNMQTRGKNNIRKPNKRYGLSALSLNGKESEPKTVNQALKHKMWRGSMSAEYDSQIRHQTWDLVPPSPHMNIIDNKWIFRLKYQPDGEIDKHKSRLVAKGFTQ